MESLDFRWSRNVANFNHIAIGSYKLFYIIRFFEVLILFLDLPKLFDEFLLLIVMFPYVKHDNGSFETVNAERIHHLTKPVNSLKKYKLAHENGSDFSNIIIVFLDGNACFVIIHVSHFIYIFRVLKILSSSDSLEELNNKIKNERARIPTARLIQSASELSDFDDAKEKLSQQEQINKTSLLDKKIKALAETKTSVSFKACSPIFYYYYTILYLYFCELFAHSLFGLSSSLYLFTVIAFKINAFI